MGDDEPKPEKFRKERGGKNRPSKVAPPHAPQHVPPRHAPQHVPPPLHVPPPSAASVASLATVAVASDASVATASVVSSAASAASPGDVYNAHIVCCRNGLLGMEEREWRWVNNITHLIMFSVGWKHNDVCSCGLYAVPSCYVPVGMLARVEGQAKLCVVISCRGDDFSMMMPSSGSGSGSSLANMPPMPPSLMPILSSSSTNLPKPMPSQSSSWNSPMPMPMTGHGEELPMTVVDWEIDKPHSSDTALDLQLVVTDRMAERVLLEGGLIPSGDLGRLVRKVDTKACKIEVNGCSVARPYLDAVLLYTYNSPFYVVLNEELRLLQSPTTAPELATMIYIVWQGHVRLLLKRLEFVPIFHR